MKKLALVETYKISGGGDEGLEAVAFTTTDRINFDEINSNWISVLAHEVWHVMQQIGSTKTENLVSE